MEKRELIQRQAEEDIVANDYTGAYVIAPRVGKSKIVTDAIGPNFISWKGHKGIFIACPYQPIADNWHYEIAKWGGIHCDATTLCFASLKNMPEGVEILVVDEWNQLSINQMQIIKKKNPKRLLLMGGTANAYSRNMLRYNLGLEVQFEYSIEQAVEDGIISNFHVYVVKVPMEKELKDHTVNGVPSTERQAYDYYTLMFDDLRVAVRTNTNLIAAKEATSRRRAELIYAAKSKLKVAQGIVQSVNERMLIFTTRTKVADKLAPYSYHSKNKEEGNLERFLDGEINTLATVKMADMGITFPQLKFELVHQLQSNSEDSLQKFLRTCNLEDEKEARIVITVCEDTVDEGWATEAMGGVPKEKITWLELDELENLLKEFG